MPFVVAEFDPGEISFFHHDRAFRRYDPPQTHTTSVHPGLAVPVNRGAPDQHRVGSAPKYRLVAGSDDALAILLAHYLAVLPHEFMHSFVAWATGIKADPFDIHWGGGSFGNVLLLYNIDEKIDYKAAYAAGKGASVAAAVLAGPGTNAVFSGGPIRGACVAHQCSTVRAYLAFSFLFMQLANVYDYVPIRWPRRMAMSGNGSGPRICPPGSSTWLSVTWCCGR